MSNDDGIEALCSHINSLSATRRHVMQLKDDMAGCQYQVGHIETAIDHLHDAVYELKQQMETIRKDNQERP